MPKVEEKNNKVTKKTEPVISNKVKEKLKKEIYSEINEDVKKDVAEKAMSDVELMMDLDYKNDLKERITNELIEDIKNDVKVEQKRIYRSKNYKIVRLYIYLLLLIAAAVFLIYKLYVNGDLDILDKITTKPADTTKVVTTQQVKDLAYYMNKYSNILDNIVINDSTLLTGTYKIKDVNISIKLGMAYNALNNNDIVTDGIISKFSGEALENAYESVFGSKEGLTHQNFVLNGINYAYSLGDNQYISINTNKNEVKVINSIINIYEENSKLIVETVSGVVSNNQLFNANDLVNKVKDYADGENISVYQDKLNRVKYTFIKVDNKYIIDQIN